MDAMTRVTVALVEALASVGDEEEATIANGDGNSANGAGYQKPIFYEAHVVWRTAAQVALSCPTFRKIFAEHPVARKSTQLLKMLTLGIANDRIVGEDSLR